jgi:hypothetical protein
VGQTTNSFHLLRTTFALHLDVPLHQFIFGV